MTSDEEERQIPVSVYDVVRKYAVMLHDQSQAQMMWGRIVEKAIRETPDKTLGQLARENELVFKKLTEGGGHVDVALAALNGELKTWARKTVV